MTVIRFRRGNKANLPVAAPSGTPLWCEDSKQLYVGTDAGVFPVGVKDNNRLSTVSYSVNSGNVDASGYPDLINKVSNTEISFKVGGSYPNMGITFPNGNYYIISSIANINAGLTADGTYIFVVEEENLTKLSDGTYLAVALAVKLGYTGVTSVIPIMTSANSPSGIASASSYNTIYDAYKAMDGGYTTYGYWSANTSTGWLQYQLASPKIINKYSILGYVAGISHDTAPPKNWTFQGSNNGVDWTILDTQTNQTSWASLVKNAYVFSNSTAYLYYRINITLNNGYTYVEIVEWELFEYFAGGNITEDIILPTSPADGDYHLLINQKPLLPKIRINGSWTEKQFLKIGQITKTGGTIGLPLITYAFDGKYECTLASLPAPNTATNFNANIGSTFVDFNFMAVNKVPELGYSFGAKTRIAVQSTTQGQPLGNIPNKNTIQCRNGSWHSGFTIIQLTDGNTANPTSANWGLELTARRRF